MLDHISWIIAEKVGALSAYDDTLRWDEVREVNDTTGWTFETSAAQGGWVVRHEGVRLTNDGLMRAYRLGLERAQHLVGE